MRNILSKSLAIIASSAVCAPAFADATSPQITVTYGAKLEKKIAEDYGMREKATIEQMVSAEIKKAFPNSNYNFSVEINNIEPNRPTFEQLSKRPGLSYESFSVGGADLSGKVIDANGNIIAQTQYDYFTPNIYDAYYSWTWADADRAISQFARKLAKSKQ